jgi:TatD DNase family protein
VGATNDNNGGGKSRKTPEAAPHIDAPMVDTHCHLNFGAYADDLNEVLARASAAHVTRIMNPGVDGDSSRDACDLAARYPGVVYAAVGYHPNDTADFSPTKLNDEIASLCDRPGVVAVGEIGLDYYWDKSPKVKQRTAFEAQLALAKALQLPVIIHSREASEDVMAVLEAWARDLPPEFRGRPGGVGVLHSFSGTLSIAERAIEAGFCLGFTGPITFKNADETRRIARLIPAERLLVETDGPYLTPAPYRGKRNEPAYIPYIVAQMAAVRGLNASAIAAITSANAERLFGLG